jgi:hypothetical protein
VADRPGHEGTPPNAGRLGKLGIPFDLPADLRDLLVSLGQEYREAFGRSEDPAAVIERDILCRSNIGLCGLSCG